MIDEIRGLLDQYAQWVRDKSVLREVNDQYVETQEGPDGNGGTSTIVTKNYTEGVKFSLGVSYSF